MSDFKSFIDLTRSIYDSREFIGLHEPTFSGNERKYVLETIDSSFVSSVGKFVDSFEEEIARYTDTKKAVAVVNGSAGLQIALKLAGVSADTEVITQALTFVATANAVSYNNAKPVFLDVDLDTMGLSPKALEEYLEAYGELREGGTFNKTTGKRISAILPMHTFGFMCRIDSIVRIAQKWNIPVVEDSAESLGSYYKKRHSGTFGSMGVFSFNGNKIITAGGGGAIVSNDVSLADRAKHLTTTAKKTHAWEYVHDELGYNFRMPNLNAALVLAQIEKIKSLISSKKQVFEEYMNGLNSDMYRLKEIPEDTQWNYWLFALEFEDNEQRESFLSETNKSGVMTRPIWELMHSLPMYSDCFRDDQTNAEKLVKSIVNIPSSARIR